MFQNLKLYFFISIFSFFSTFLFATTTLQFNPLLPNNLQYVNSFDTSTLSGYELLANKSSNISLGTSNTLYPTQNAVKSYVDTSTTTLNSIKEDKLYSSGIEIWIDGTRTDNYVENGTIARPYKTINAAMSVVTTTACIHLAPTTYTSTNNLTLPNVPMVVYGNGAILISTNTITINNPNFVRYNLFTTAANVVYNNFSTGARCLVQGGGITGNITINSYVEFTQCQLNGGIVTVGNTGQCVLSLLSPTSKFVSNGILTMERINMNTNYNGYLVTSMNGQLTVVNSIFYNSSNGLFSGGIACDNGAITAPNIIANNFISCPFAQLYGLFAGTSYTVYSKNYISAPLPTGGTHLLPINTDMVGGGTVMAVGSDATGDMYYRNSSYLLTRLGIGTSTTTLRGGTVPTYDSIPNILGYTPVNKSGDTMTGNLTAPNFIATYGINISTGIVGTTANFTDFPNAKFIASQGNTGHTYTGAIGLVGEALASVSDTGTGVGGVAKTNGLNQGRGVSGVGKVDATGDLGAAIGVYGRAEDTHAGGKNIGCYGYAINGATNYSFYGSAGDIYNNGNLILSSAGDGIIDLYTSSGSTQTIISSSGVSAFGGGNVLVGTTTVSLATSGLTAYQKDIRISTTTISGNGIYFQDNSFQTRAYAPIVVSSQNISSAINIASTSDIYVSTITLTQIGGKNIEVIGSFEFTSDATKTHTISLYRDSTLLQSWTHQIGAGDDEPLPAMWFKDMSSTAGTAVYTIRVHSSAATGTQTVANYNWRVRED